MNPRGARPQGGVITGGSDESEDFSNSGWDARILHSCEILNLHVRAEQVRGYCLIRRKMSSTRGIQSRTCVFTAHASGGRWGYRQSEVYRIPFE